MKFNVKKNASTEMVLTEDALTLNNQLRIGTSSSNSTLELEGSIGMSIQNVSSNTLLSGNSFIYVDTSQGNITLELPEARNMHGRQYFIKKYKQENELKIIGGPIDHYDHLILKSNSLLNPYLSLQSFNQNWHILDLSGNIQEIASSNLNAWYGFNEVSGSTAYDLSQSSFNGSLINLSYSSGAIDGVLGQGLSFDGTDDHIDLGNNFNYSNHFSIACWVKFSSTTGRICSKRSGTTGIDLFITNGRVGYYDGSTTIKSSAINDNTWHHVTLVINGNNSFIYVDGSINKTINASITLNSANFYIGRNGTSYFQGEMDDFRIYNKPLSSAEVNSLYKMAIF